MPWSKPHHDRDAVLGANDGEKIVELKLTADELAQLKKSANHVLENVKRLNL
ncbi:MAG TPA: hypothetical protein VL486_07145 [Verrucomicrobiae bacterium]|nr:hypothetical protein [Verrucomicrobiae bacterium]